MHLSILLLVLSMFSLSVAYISEHVFGLLPCVLCIYQRIPFFVVIALSLISLKVEGKVRATLLILCGLTLWVGAGIALYHVGVEKGMFTLTQGCVDTMGEVSSLEEFRNTLIGTPAVPCDKPQLVVLGLSMAGWNFFYSFALGLLTLVMTYRAWTFYKKILNS